MVEACARFCLRTKGAAIPSWLTLLGDTGTGKTHCADAVWRKRHGKFDWRNCDWSPHKIYWPAFVLSLRSGEAYSKVSDMARWPMLYLDDICAERDTTGFAAEQLCTLLGQRQSKWTIITSNRTVAQIAEMDVRLADRIVREPGNELVEVNTVSYAMRQRPHHNDP
jgi:DNA replication protein DnaC